MEPIEAPGNEEAPKPRPYHRVLYVTVQSDPLPKRQRMVGSEGFVGSCRHACLDHDVACAGDAAVSHIFSC